MVSDLAPVRHYFFCCREKTALLCTGFISLFGSRAAHSETPNYPNNIVMAFQSTTDTEPPVPDHPNVNVEAENPEDSALDSDLESLAGSTTASMSSSLYAYTYENGR